jgi:predicted permease
MSHAIMPLHLEFLKESRGETGDDRAGARLTLLNRLASVVRRLANRKMAEQELNDELEMFVEMGAADRMRNGVPPAQARRQAVLHLGGVAQAKERIRSARVGAGVETVWQDVVHAVRGLRREPGFAAVIIATMALGIGANTAIFTLVNAVLLRPLNVADADRIVRFVGASGGSPLLPTAALPIAQTWLQQEGVFEDVSAHRLDLVNLTGTLDPQQIAVARVTHKFFRLFGATLFAGRTFSIDEDRPGAERVAVLSHGIWMRQFGSRPDIIGQAISLGNEPHVVIGIFEPAFDTEQFGQVPDAWVPLRLDPASRDVGGEFVFVSARLRPGATVEAGNAQMEVAAAEFMRTPGPGAVKRSFAVQPVKDAMVGNVRESLILLEAAVGLVLLIACANVANLLLVRGSGRTRELAVRAAIGAGRVRIVRQLITESLVIAAIGAICGVAVGLVAIRGLLATYPGANPTILGNAFTGIPRIGQTAAVGIDWRVVIVATAVTLAAGIAAGLFPALQASRVDVQQALRRTGGGTSDGHQRLRATLVIAEIALAVMLVAGAGLLIRTSLALRAVEPGFESKNVLTMRMAVSGTPFERQDGIGLLTRQGIDRIRAVPGVLAASTTCCMPLETVWQLPFVIQSGAPADTSRVMAGWTFVSPGYFDVFKIPLLRGRDFDDRDDPSGPGVVIINQEMARRFWGDRDPLGDHLLIGRGVRPDYEADPLRQIVGIVADVRDTSLRRTPRPAMYVPVAQIPDGVTVLNVRLLPIVWVARTSGNPHAAAAAVRRELQTVSNGLPIARIRSMEEVVSESTARTRFDMLLMSVFAVSALALAAVGIYGLLAYSVRQRTREIGVRLALGASPAQVRGMILRRGIALAAAGMSVGLAVSYGFAQLLAGLLFGVSPRDAITFVAVSVVLGSVAVLAAALPAMRASRLTPMTALRHE